MSAMNGVAVLNNVPAILALKNKRRERFEDPELEAEFRYAKENGLAEPKGLLGSNNNVAAAPAKKADSVDGKPAALSLRNRSKSTSDVQKSPKSKASKAERKARSRGVSGTFSRKDRNHFEYGLDDLYCDEDEDYIATDVEEDGNDEYVDYVFTFDVEKVRGALSEYFSNGDCECAMSELTDHLYNSETRQRVAKELVRLSLDYDLSKVGLGHKLMAELLNAKHITEKAIFSAIEDLLPELEEMLKDMPRAREHLAVFIAKTIADHVMPRMVFDDITSKLNANRQAMSCCLEVYMYLNNRRLLAGKFEPRGGYESLEAIHDQFEKIMKEFLVSGDEEEVVERLRFLHVPHYHHDLIYLVGSMAMEKMNESVMDKFAKLLKHLFDTGFLLNSCLKPGFEHLFKSLSDLSIDLPAAHSLCDLWVKKCKKHGVVDEHITKLLPKPCAARPRTLSESADGKLVCIDTPNCEPIEA